MDPAEYKHVVLGFIFLKYISDAFEEYRVTLENKTADPHSEYYIKDPKARYEVIEDRDEYKGENIFWVPKEARWEEIGKHGYVLTPGRYVGVEPQEDDGVPFEEKMERLTSQLKEQFEESRKLETTIRSNLEELGYEIK